MQKIYTTINTIFLCFVGMTAFGQTFQSGTNVTIPDAGAEVCSGIAVTGIGVINGTFGLETVCIKINHTFDGDLDIFLVAPDGTRVELSTDNGGAGANYGSGTNNNGGTLSCFDMAAGTNITAGTAPFQASFVPEGNLGTVNNGQNANGTWQLCVTDDAGGDTGFINAWQLTFGNNPAPPGGGGGSGHNIGTGNLTSCSSGLFDTGGSGSDYSASESFTETYCSAVAGQCVQVVFNSFNTESCCDHLNIYNGPNTASPLIGTFNGTNSPGTVTSTGGCLTFEWTSDGSVQNSGWDATLSCVACPTCSDGILNGQEVGIDCGGPDCAACPCAALPVINDEACCATPVTVNADNNCTSTTPGTVVGATPSFNGNTCFGTDDDDVWFSFVATSSEHNVSILNTAGSTTDMYHVVYDGTCNALGTALVCSDADNSNISSLTVGNTYFIRVYTYTATAGQTSTFDVCVTSPCAGIPEPTCNLNYTYVPTLYNPDNYNTGTSYTFTDDRFADNFTPIGFDFCFDGVTYQDCMVSSNGYLIFPGCFSEHGGNDVVPTGTSDWSISAAIPNLNDAPRNAILGPWQDIDPGVAGTVRTRTHGTAPNRRFVAKFSNVAMFSCNAMLFTGQIILYETTNVIEVHIGEKNVCAGWNGGAAILGLHDYTGTQAVVPAGRNFPTQWSVATLTPEGHQFIPSCPGGVCTVLLPTEMLSFDGTAKAEYNQLNWTTATEKDSKYFVVEKSTNGYSFVALGTLDAAGNSTSPISYQYEDHAIEEGVVYYRLRQVGTNGKVAYSKIISIRRGDKGAPAVNIFPNPSSDNVVSIISETNSSPIKAISMTNYLGQTVAVQMDIISDNEVKISTAGMPSGSYVVEVKFTHGASVYKKLILN